MRYAALALVVLLGVACSEKVVVMTPDERAVAACRQSLSSLPAFEGGATGQAKLAVRSPECGRLSAAQAERFYWTYTVSR